MSQYDQAFADLFGNEGGFSDTKGDPGGKTFYGVIETTARRHGYTGRMEDMTAQQAKEVLRQEYWPDNLEYIPYRIAFPVFDACVQHGPSEGVKQLQRAANVTADGIFGSGTLRAVLDGDHDALLFRIHAERLAFLATRPTWSTFSNGYANRVVKNLRRSGS